MQPSPASLEVSLHKKQQEIPESVSPQLSQSLPVESSTSTSITETTVNRSSLGLTLNWIAWAIVPAFPMFVCVGLSHRLLVACVLAGIFIAMSVVRVKYKHVSKTWNKVCAATIRQLQAHLNEGLDTAVYCLEHPEDINFPKLVGYYTRVVLKVVLFIIQVVGEVHDHPVLTSLFLFPLVVECASASVTLSLSACFSWVMISTVASVYHRVRNEYAIQKDIMYTQMRSGTLQDSLIKKRHHHNSSQ